MIFHKKQLVALVAAGKAALAGDVGAQTVGGKSQLGKTRLALDLVPNSNAVVCYSTSEKLSPGQFVPSNISLVVNPFNQATAQLTFSVGDVPVEKRDRTLILIVNNTTVATPSIATPLSTYPVGLAMSGLEVLASYTIRASTLEAQSVTRVGFASSELRSKMVFEVQLDNTKLPTLMSSGTQLLYVQAGLLPKSDYDVAKFDNMILSPVTNITLINPVSSGTACPSGYASFSSNTNSELVVNTGSTTLTKSGISTTAVSGKTKATGK